MVELPGRERNLDRTREDRLPAAQGRAAVCAGPGLQERDGVGGWDSAPALGTEALAARSSNQQPTQLIHRSEPPCAPAFEIYGTYILEELYT